MKIVIATALFAAANAEMVALLDDENAKMDLDHYISGGELVFTGTMQDKTGTTPADLCLGGYIMTMDLGSILADLMAEMTAMMESGETPDAEVMAEKQAEMEQKQKDMEENFFMSGPMFARAVDPDSGLKVNML